MCAVQGVWIDKEKTVNTLSCWLAVPSTSSSPEAPPGFLWPAAVLAVVTGAAMLSRRIAG